MSLSPLPPRTLVIERLACRRGERLLFADLSLSVEPGQVVEVRGPNGVGKTSLLLIAAGLMRADAGTVAITGGDPDAETALDIGYFGHRTAVKPRLTVMENLVFWADLCHRPRAGVLPALETVGLAPIAGLDAGHLSAGQTRRLALARLLLVDRPVWLLDEPTAALDAEGHELVARLIDAHVDRGGLALVATHHELGLRHGTGRLLLSRPQVAA